MNLRNEVQKILDGVLLSDGVMSHHLRRVKVDAITDADGNEITVNPDEYTVYRITSGANRTYGDGRPLREQYFVSVNYYYAYDKGDSIVATAEKRIKSIMRAFVGNGNFLVVSGASDVYDIDNPYRGINVEFKYIGVIQNGDD